MNKEEVRIEQVENGFIVYLNSNNTERGMVPTYGQRMVFNTQSQLNKFLSEYFKKE